MSGFAQRKFDHDEARARYAKGESGTKLASEYGVSSTAIYLVVNPEFRRRQAERKARWQREATCVDCGAQITRITKDERHRCRACWAKKMSTTVRDTTLKCECCREWKPDGEFHRSSSEQHRRERHKTCRACSAARRRLTRQRNPETRERENRKRMDRYHAKRAAT